MAFESATRDLAPERRGSESSRGRGPRAGKHPGCVTGRGAPRGCELAGKGGRGRDPTVLTARPTRPPRSQPLRGGQRAVGEKNPRSSPPEATGHTGRACTILGTARTRLPANPHTTRDLREKQAVVKPVRSLGSGCPGCGRCLCHHVTLGSLPFENRRAGPAESWWESCHGRAGLPPQLPPVSGAPKARRPQPTLLERTERVGGPICPAGWRGAAARCPWIWTSGMRRTGRWGRPSRPRGKGVEEAWGGIRMHPSGLVLGVERQVTNTEGAVESERPPFCSPKTHVDTACRHSG